jgi:hypothetical protein
VSRETLYENAESIIKRTQEIVKLLMQIGHIEPPPPEPQ